MFLMFTSFTATCQILQIYYVPGLYAELKDEAVTLLVKLLKKEQNKGGCWPSSSICVLILNEKLFQVNLLAS